MTQQPKDFRELTQAKIEARQQLLALSAEEAQKRVETILYPQYWQLDTAQPLWQESLPTNNEDLDP
ncbi:MAG: hypothetical protein ACRC6M_09955 [Microcystaceae cyanobacterium]